MYLNIFGFVCPNEDCWLIFEKKHGFHIKFNTNKDYNYSGAQISKDELG